MRVGRAYPAGLLAAVLLSPGCWVLTKDEIDQHDLALGGTDGGPDTDGVGDTDDDTDDTDAVDTDDTSDTDGPVVNLCEGKAAPTWEPEMLDIDDPLAPLPTDPVFDYEVPRAFAVGPFVPGDQDGFAIVSHSDAVFVFTQESGAPHLDFSEVYADFLPSVGTDVVIAHVDDDVFGDVLVATGQVASYSVLFGSIGGLFSEVQFDSDAAPISLDEGDVTGDGVSDLVGLSAAGEIVVYTGNAPEAHDGAVPVGGDFEAPKLVRLADLEPGGPLEIIAIDAPGNLLVLRGTGGLVFEEKALTFPSSASPSGIATGDFDHDGDLDVAISTEVGGNVTIFRGDGHGGLELATTIPLHSSPRGVVAVDPDGSGCVSLVVALGEANQVVLLPGLGANAFGEPVVLASLQNPLGVGVGSLDGEGGPDLLSVGTGREIVVLKGVTP